MGKSEADHAREMYDKGVRDGSHGGAQDKTPSDRTYSDYVRDAGNYREGVAVGEKASKNK